MTDSTRGNISGNITPEEIAADARANANQETRPSIAVERGLRDLRNLGGTRPKK